MNIMQTNKEVFIKGLCKFVGLSSSKLKHMSEAELLQIMDHPMLIDATSSQEQKLVMLKQFINSYQYYRKGNSEMQSYNSPEKIADYFFSKVGYQKDRESFMIAYLDSKMQLMCCDEYQGSVNMCSVQPRDLVKRALQFDCACIIIGHNHPSGDPHPSKEDITITKRLVAIFDSMGIPLQDHIIVGSEHYLSMKEQGYMDNMKQLPKMSDYMPIAISKISEISEREEEFEPE